MAPSTQAARQMYSQHSRRRELLLQQEQDRRHQPQRDLRQRRSARSRQDPRSAHSRRHPERHQFQPQRSIRQSLERTRGLLVQNLDRTTHSMLTLKSSSDTLLQTFSTHQDFGSSLLQSRGILYRLKMSERLDQYLTLVSFVLLVLVVFYVEECRIGLLRLAVGTVLQSMSMILGLSWQSYPDNTAVANEVTAGS